MIKTQAEVALMSNEEIDAEVKKHFHIMIKTQGKGLTEEEKEFDKMLKAEYWIRESAGLHEIPCMICTDQNVTAYEIMKQFSSDVNKIGRNICRLHRDAFHDKMGEFLDQHD